MRFETITLTAPTVEPITIDEARAQLRLTSLQTYDDAYISALIPVARDRAERYCNRYFTNQEIKIIAYDGWTATDLILPFPDLVSVGVVSYVNIYGVESVIDPADYTFDSDTRMLFAADGWPTDADSIKVTVTTSAPVEFEGAKQAMLMILTDLYELRTETVTGASVAENPAVCALLHQYRVNMGV